MPLSSDSSSANQSTEDPETKATSLEFLPQPVAALIYSQLDAAGRRALLQVSRWARDVVLREARSISLQVFSRAPRKPTLQLLETARTSGTVAKLSVAACNFNRNSKNKLFSDLFGPATQQAGWAFVKTLVLKGFPRRGARTRLLSSAFPALQRLELLGLSLDYADVSRLADCSCLSSLKLSNCNVITTPPGTSSPLATIGSLRQLCLGGVSSSFAAGLAQLTSLSVGSSELPSKRLANISGLTQLQHLEYPAAASTYGWYGFREVKHVCTTFTQLRGLALCGKVSQADFDVLLAHATYLTHLTVGDLHLQEDRSATPCSWKELVTKHQAVDIVTLACLPTASLAAFAFEDNSAVVPSPSPHLSFVPSEMSGLHGAFQIVRRGLINLKQSPAWLQCGPRVHVRLLSDWGAGASELLSQWTCALAPLASNEVKLSISTPYVTIKDFGVQQLGGALGSNLKQLLLQRCALSKDFWPAVWTHLPGLQQLTLTDGVWGSGTGCISVDELTSFCSHATRPLQLSLGQRLYKKVGAEGKLDQWGRWRGVPQVTVTLTAAVDV